MVWLLSNRFFFNCFTDLDSDCKETCRDAQVAHVIPYFCRVNESESEHSAASSLINI